MRYLALFLTLILFLLMPLGGCTTQPEAQTAPEASAPPGVTPTPTAISTPPTTLRVWLPATLAPEANPHAYKRLEERIQAFAHAHNLTIEIRIKPLDGPSGMLTTLQAARMVAPGAVPDVVLFPHALLEAAAIKGLAFPLTESALTTPLSADDWFPYARQLATVQSITYGVPFSGDALGLLYHPDAVASPPATWNEWLQMPQQWLLPLGDPQATALLTLYLAAGGKWEDENGRPMLEEDALEQMLTLLQQAVQNHRLDPVLLDIPNDHALWARNQGAAQALMITYISHLLPGPDPRRMAPIPASSHTAPIALADGLLWALTTPQPNRQPLAMALIADLNDPDFVAQWTEAAGFLPPRQSCLNAWENDEHRTLAAAILPALQPGPPQQVSTVLGPVLQEAAAQVVLGKQTPASAAHWAVSTLEGDQ